MSIRNSLLMSTLVAVLGAELAFGQGASPATRRYVFPPVTIANGETAQVNVANVGASATSCTGSIVITNPGGPVSDPFPFTVSSGQIVSVSFPNNSANRLQILAFIAVSSIVAPTGVSNYPCPIVFSLELFGSNTHVVLTNPTLIPGQVHSGNRP
jgi:hypothetical protein